MVLLDLIPYEGGPRYIHIIYDFGPSLYSR